MLEALGTTEDEFAGMLEALGYTGD